MGQNQQCPKCGNLLQPNDKYRYGTEVICGACYDKAADSPQVCPNCERTVDEKATGVGLLLTPVGSSEKEKSKATETLVIVCPHCRVLFFDEFQYKIMEGLQQIQEEKEK